MEGDDQLLKVIFWPLYTCCGTGTSTFKHVIIKITKIYSLSWTRNVSYWQSVLIACVHQGCNFIGKQAVFQRRLRLMMKVCNQVERLERMIRSSLSPAWEPTWEVASGELVKKRVLCPLLLMTQWQSAEQVCSSLRAEVLLCCRPAQWAGGRYLCSGRGLCLSFSMTLWDF